MLKFFDLVFPKKIGEGLKVNFLFQPTIDCFNFLKLLFNQPFSSSQMGVYGQPPNADTSQALSSMSEFVLRSLSVFNLD